MMLRFASVYMKCHTIGAFWLMLMVGLLICAGNTAAEIVDFSRPSVSKNHSVSVANNLPDLISITTELNNRSVALEKEITDLFDLPAIQKSLARMAKETKSLSRKLKLLKNTTGYGYDSLFDVKALIAQKADDLQEIIQSINESVNLAEHWEKEWADEGMRWEQLESSLSKQVPSQTLEPTFDRVRHIITGSKGDIDRAMESLTAQRQMAEVIRSSQSSLDIELDALVSVLGDNLMHKTARSMASSKYYRLLKKGLQKELPDSLHRLSSPDLQFFKRWGWLVFIQAVLSLFLCIGITQQRHRLMEKEQWRFIARRPIEVGIFVAAITTSSFYGAVPGAWRLLALCVVILSLARLVVAFVGDAYKRRCLVYGLSAYLIVTRSFGVFGLPHSLFRLYIFSTTLVGIFICLWRSAASARRGDARLYTRALRLGALLCLLILIAEMGGYSALSAHLLESSLKTILIVLAGWMLMVMLRSFVEWAIDSPPFKKIPLLQVKARIIISRSALLSNLFAATLTGTFMLVAWRVYSNPVEAIQAVWSFGFTMGPRRITLGLMLTAAAFLYCAFFVSWAVQAILMDGLFTRRQLQVGVRISIARLVHYGFIFIGFLLALLTLGVKLRDFTIIAGALGVGIGFGLQGIINNFVSGLILLFERPIKVGDHIEIGAQRAEIKNIGLRATVVQTPDRSEIVVPNSDLISKQVTNWTLSDQYAGIRIPVGVAYGSDVPHVMQTLLECAQEHAQVVAHPAPKVLFIGFGESSLDFELRGWIAEVNNMLQIKSELYQEIDRKFRSLDIRIPFPQHDLHVNVMGKSVPVASGKSKDWHFNLHTRKVPCV
jgi:small-conductance mechanosensitive channel